MKQVIIETEAMTRFNTAVDSVLDGGRSYSGFILAYGQAGRGKSIAADTYYINRGGAYVRVWEGWSQSAFLQHVLFEVKGRNGDMARHNGNRCKELIVNALDENFMPIFIDEADRLAIGRIEDLRDIQERTGIPIVLIGEQGLSGMLSERRRIWSRVVDEVEFGPINAMEVGLYTMQAANLSIPPALCKKMADKADGDFRLVRNMTMLLEKSAKATETYTIDKAMLEDVFGQRSWKRG